MMLRQRVCDLMTRVHGISPELAAYHVGEMSPSEVRQRFLMYVRDRIAGPELSVAGSKTEPVNVSSTLDQKTGQADPVSLQQKISKLIVASHVISPELACYHVSQMDETELLLRFQQYVGAELKGKGSS